MKRDITVMVLGLLLLSLQGALLRGAPIRMDLITLIIVYLALERGVLSGAVVAACIAVSALTYVVLFCALVAHLDALEFMKASGTHWKRMNGAWSWVRT